VNTDQLFSNIMRKKSFLCIGLDSELDKLPESVLNAEDPVFEFNRQLIDATHDLVIAYKPNTAFYEIAGAQGWRSLERTVNYIKRNYPDILVIADAKRGDIGNTSAMYARAFFETLGADAVTVAPYMGEDSVKPFLSYPEKWAIVLALTSNKGSEDFQQHYDSFQHQYYFERVLHESKEWGTEENLMYVVGANQAIKLIDIRKIVPDHFLLIPGVGAQGGSLTDVATYGMNNKCGLIVNSSRAIIFADSSKKFASVAREKAKEVREEMEFLLGQYC